MAAQDVRPSSVEDWSVQTRLGATGLGQKCDRIILRIGLCHVQSDVSVQCGTFKDAFALTTELKFSYSGLV